MKHGRSPHALEGRKRHACKHNTQKHTIDTHKQTINTYKQTADTNKHTQTHTIALPTQTQVCTRCVPTNRRGHYVCVPRHRPDGELGPSAQEREPEPESDPERRGLKGAGPALGESGERGAAAGASLAME